MSDAKPVPRCARAVMSAILDSLKRKNGNCGAAVPEGDTHPFSLIVGAPTAIKIESAGRRGLVIMLGLSRERLIALRDEINLLLEHNKGN